MATVRAFANFSLATMLALVSSGCAGPGGETGGLGLPDLSKVALPTVELPKVELPKVELPQASRPVVGSPTEVYTRVAQGALSCWFGASGPLKSSYIYNAEAESPSRGGKAEIVVHERKPPAPGLDIRGPRALKVDIQPEGETAKVSFENYKFSTEIGQSFHSDVDRWASGETGCGPPGAAVAGPTQTSPPPTQKQAKQQSAKTSKQNPRAASTK